MAISETQVLRCPICGYEMEVWKGWAFATNSRTLCEGKPDTPRALEGYRHPFELVAKDNHD